MKTEMEKCLAGEWYDCHDPFFMDLKSKAHHLLMKYNSLPYDIVHGLFQTGVQYPCIVLRHSC